MVFGREFVPWIFYFLYFLGDHAKKTRGEDGLGGLDMDMLDLPLGESHDAGKLPS